MAIRRTSQDLPRRWVGLGVLAVVLVIALFPSVLGGSLAIGVRVVAAILIAVFAFFFVTVASRIVGLVGVTSNPTSGMTIAALIGTSSVFLAFGWTDDAGKAAALTVGCVVAIAASIAGDTSQDLKTGFLLGATPRRQQVGELIGVLTSSVFVCMTILLLNEAYRDPNVPGSTGFGTTDLPAPQATLMKLVIEGVLQQQLPWALVGIGAGLAILAAVIRLPSLPFAVGVYLPVTTMVPVFLGGLLRLAMERRGASDEEKAERRERGILLGSGLVGGEGLFGVLIAGAVAWQIRFGDTSKGILLPGQSHGAEITAVVLFAVLVGYLAQRIRRTD
ncbi:MAG: OPT/YSL family transporter, partial [Planctomycetes bacterium]|nr:OPT/YSL family transporter [Planctomycetota bacterium]